MPNTSLKSFNQAQLRAGQLRMLDILLAIDAICRQYNLTYWIDNGTLLGAARHGGFIPWDDDMDIAMPVADFERFSALVSEHLPKGLVFQSGNNNRGRICALPKVRDLNSFYVEAHDDLSLPVPRGLFVDITPFKDFSTRNVQLLRRVARGLSVANSILHQRHYYSLRSFVEFFHFSAKSVWLRFLWVLFTGRGKQNLRTAPLNPLNGYGLSHDVKTIMPLRKIKFEGHDFPAPAKTDEYLTEVYGNWQELPPEDKRKFHSVFMMPQLISHEE